MKKVIILHGFEGQPNSNWFPWLMNTLAQAGYHVEIPALPNPYHPDSAQVLPWLEEFLGPDTQNTILVGHSLGAYWAAKLAEKYTFHQLILVAPAVEPLPYDRYRELWPESDIDALEKTITHDIDWNSVSGTNNAAIFSADDHLIPAENMSLFHDRNWKTLMLTNGERHICVPALPEILEFFEDSSS